MFMFAWKGVLPLKCVSNISYRCLHVDSDQQKKKKKKKLSWYGNPGPDAYRICNAYL